MRVRETIEGEVDSSGQILLEMMLTLLYAAGVGEADRTVGKSAAS